MGLLGHGDCAPLLAAGTETPESALEQLNALLPLLRGSNPQIALAVLDESAFRAPAARCALESALLDLLAQQAGLPLARWLNPGAPLAARANAMLGGLDEQGETVMARASAALAAGFSVLKLKVGMAAAEIELTQLRRLAGMLPPGVSLRLDANGAWGWAQARCFIEGLSDLPIESLEEPLAQPEIALLQQLQALAGFPLALDESLVQFDIESLLAVRRLVLKPMVLGGVRPAYALALRAAQAGVECVATTTVDSAVGVLAAAHLAAALDNQLAHGVATSSWLLSDVGNAPLLESGRMLLNSHMNGLGFQAQAE